MKNKSGIENTGLFFGDDTEYLPERQEKDCNRLEARGEWKENK